VREPPLLCDAMTEDIVDILEEKIAYLEKQIQDKESKTTSFDEYLREMKIYSDTPRDQFAHQYKLLYHPSQEITKKSKRSELFNPDILLGNIKDSKSLYFLQRDFAILHRLFDMGQRSPGVMDLFNNLYYPWVGQIRLTSALGGSERSLQSFLEPYQQQSESFSYWQKRQEKKKQRKHLKDYIPSRGGEGGGGGSNYD
jgi:hypothetical protein